MAIPYSAIAAAAALAAGAALKGEEGRALNNGPDYIRDGNPTGVVDKLGQAIARNTCRRYADNPDAVDGERALDFERVCRPYLDNIGYGEGPEVGLPFRGGQCPIRYNVVHRLVLNGNPQQTLTASLIGPVTGGRAVNPGNNNWQALFTANGRHLGGMGQPCGAFAQTGPGEYVGATLATAPDQTVTLEILDLIPCPLDGGDDCGNPDVDVRQPLPPDNPDDNPEPFNPGPDIDVDIDVTVNVDGSINVDVGTGPIVINPFGGGGNGGPGGEPGPDPDTSPPAPEPGPENPGGNGGFGGDDMFGEPPAGRRWVGCCIRITQTPSNASVIATSEPEDVYPGVIGNLRLVCDAAGNRFTDTPVRILAKHVCVWEPVQKLNPVGVRVDLLPGYGYTFRPYSVPSGD